MADDKTIQLAINTIRTLSIDAVRHRVTLLVGYGDRQCAVRSASLCLFTSNAACSPSDFGPIRRPFLPDPVGDSSVLNEPVEVQAWSKVQLSYLNDSITRAR
jgi:hypothetical protein